MNSKSDKDKFGRHKTKILFYPHENRKVNVDRGIASLISLMWELGIHTTNSCQAVCNFNCNHKNKAVKIKSGPSKGLSYLEPIKTDYCYNNVWVAFESMSDVELLYNYVAEYSDDSNSMYECMCCGLFVAHSGDNCARPKDHWSFAFVMRNLGVNDRSKQNNFVMQPQITFPQKHLSYVEDRLKLALKDKI